jgi:hypothetical protein
MSHQRGNGDRGGRRTSAVSSWMTCRGATVGVAPQTPPWYYDRPLPCLMCRAALPNIIMGMT